MHQLRCYQIPFIDLFLISLQICPDARRPAVEGRSLQSLGLSLKEGAEYYYDTYIAACTGKMSMTARMFTVRMSQDVHTLKLMCRIPMANDFDGEERTEFAETNALCIYYRGAYEGTADVIRALHSYIREHGIEISGGFRSIYLEGPPNRGTNRDDYITQIAVPVAGSYINS